MYLNLKHCKIPANYSSQSCPYSTEPQQGNSNETRIIEAAKANNPVRGLGGLFCDIGQMAPVVFKS